MYNKLTEEEKRIIIDKGTEYPFTGEYDDFWEEGDFICRQCNNLLFSSKTKFDAGCGWPAFDDCYPNSIKRLIDADGQRIEIQCIKCGGHLGHVFEGERFTQKNTRYCVNSLSLKFVKNAKMQ
jgi:peptide-methionine (R)-S-oxide reductase